MKIVTFRSAKISMTKQWSGNENVFRINIGQRRCCDIAYKMWIDGMTEGLLSPLDDLVVERLLSHRRTMT